MIGFIGGGNMAEALIRGLASKGGAEIIVSDPMDEKRSKLQKRYGATATAENMEVVRKADIIVLAVKPQNMAAVLDEIAPAVGEEKTVVSIAAGIRLDYLMDRLKTRKIIRVMPNTPALVGEGMSVLSLCECMDDKDAARVRDIFMAVGRVVVLPEKHMDAVTAVSGSGPAFIAHFVEAMIEAGAALGLDETTAAELATQTLIGTAGLVASGTGPAELRKAVTSPGGTTAAGLKSFDEGGLVKLVRDALKAAADRSKELAGGG